MFTNTKTSALKSAQTVTVTSDQMHSRICTRFNALRCPTDTEKGILEVLASQMSTVVASQLELPVAFMSEVPKHLFEYRDDHDLRSAWIKHTSISLPIFTGALYKFYREIDDHEIWPADFFSIFSKFNFALHCMTAIAYAAPARMEKGLKADAFKQQVQKHLTDYFFESDRELNTHKHLDWFSSLHASIVSRAMTILAFDQVFDLLEEGGVTYVRLTDRGRAAISPLQELFGKEIYTLVGLKQPVMNRIHNCINTDPRPRVKSPARVARRQPDWRDQLEALRESLSSQRGATA